MALGTILGIAQMGIGYCWFNRRSISAASAAAAAQAKQRNEDLIKQYEYQLKITRETRTKNQNQILGTKLGIYNQANTAADRAASRAYGMEMTINLNGLNKLLPQVSSEASWHRLPVLLAAGKSGRNAQRL